MSGLKKKGPARRAPKRVRQGYATESIQAMPNSKKRNRKDSLKGFFFEYD